MATEAGEFPRFSFGSTINDIFGVIGRNFLLLCGLALLLYGLPAAIFTIFIMEGVMALIPDPSVGTGAAPPSFDFLNMFGTSFVIGGIGSIIISIYTQGAMIWSAAEDLDGRKPSFGGAMAAGLRFFLPILAVTVILYVILGAIVAVPIMLMFSIDAFGLGIALFLLIIVPLIFFLMVALLAAVPAIVAEEIGPIDALGRSWDLTAGHRWKLFAMILIYGFAAIIISSAISGATMPFMMMGDMTDGSAFDGLMPIMAAQSFLGSLTLVITYPAITATYHNLRIAKEGIRHERVTDVFE